MYQVKTIYTCWKSFDNFLIRPRLAYYWTCHYYLIVGEAENIKMSKIDQKYSIAKFKVEK